MFRKSVISSLSLFQNITIKTVRTLLVSPFSDVLTYKKSCRLLIDQEKPLPVGTYRFSAASEKSGYDESKAEIILLLNFKSAQDALPFYKLPIRTLKHIQKVTENDQRNGFCDNRLYYIASCIKCPPNVLSERLAKRIFIYSLTFDWLKRSLDVLLEMDVSGDRILRDLWVLKYNHDTIHKRLTRVQYMGVDTLYPWMVRCSEDILNRSIQLSQETKDILGENKNTQIYLANRLNISLEAIEEISCKMPALKTMRVIKVKKFLDFLTAEGFTVEDIASKPRVLFASQKTVQQRLEKLRHLGFEEINLNVLCRSRKGFKRFCDSIETFSKNADP